MERDDTMPKHLTSLIPALLVFLLLSACKTRCFSVSPEELEIIGELIFINEGGGKEKNLTVWNEGEEFASLGIGHFLWYPRDREYRFQETFPSLFEFLKSEGASAPAWMEELPSFDLPWSSRGEFYRDFNSAEMKSLRKFLLDTIPLQSLFIADRLEDSLPRMLKAAPAESRGNIKKQFYRVANSRMGIYVLMDYVNFKGEGTSESERYNGEGWGLLQVLDNMNGEEEGLPALREFADSAEMVLKRRVKNSPPERNEKRWIPGWRNRLKTYVPGDLSTYAKSESSHVNEGESNPLGLIKEIYRGLVCKFR